jgi:hypothetical protein
MPMSVVKYRLTEPKLCPRRTKIEVPGWAGKPHPRADGSQEYAWHCVPFSEYARYGIEVLYPYENEVRVTRCGNNFDEDGFSVFHSDWGTPPKDGRSWPPFRVFGKEFYSFQLLLDLKVEAGLAVKVETHPRFYTDGSNSTPLAVPAIIRSWWPMIFFLIFKTPAKGQMHIFRPGEPFVQFTFIPEEPDFELVEMGEEEAAERELQSRRIYEARSTITKDSQWTSATNTVFDATYRRLAGAARKCQR